MQGKHFLLVLCFEYFVVTVACLCSLLKARCVDVAGEHIWQALLTVLQLSDRTSSDEFEVISPLTDELHYLGFNLCMLLRGDRSSKFKFCRILSKAVWKTTCCETPPCVMNTILHLLRSVWASSILSGISLFGLLQALRLPKYFRWDLFERYNQDLAIQHPSST